MVRAYGDVDSFPLEELPEGPWSETLSPGPVPPEPPLLLQTLIYNSKMAVRMGRDTRAGFHWIGPDGSCEVCPITGQPDLWRVRVSTKEKKDEL